jgi:hypothetical protein
MKSLSLLPYEVLALLRTPQEEAVTQTDGMLSLAPP